MINYQGDSAQLNAANTTTGNEVYVKDLSKADAELLAVQANMDANVSLVDTHGEDLLFLTDLNAPNNRLVKVSLEKPSAEHWQDVISEAENVLSVSSGGGYLFAS